MPFKRKEKKDNKLRNFLLTAGIATGSGALGLYLLRKGKNPINVTNKTLQNLPNISQPKNIVKEPPIIPVANVTLPDPTKTVNKNVNVKSFLRRNKKGKVSRVGGYLKNIRVRPEVIQNNAIQKTLQDINTRLENKSIKNAIQKLDNKTIQNISESVGNANSKLYADIDRPVKIIDDKLVSNLRQKLKERLKLRGTLQDKLSQSNVRYNPPKVEQPKVEPFDEKVLEGRNPPKGLLNPALTYDDIAPKQNKPKRFLRDMGNVDIGRTTQKQLPPGDPRPNASNIRPKQLRIKTKNETPRQTPTTEQTIKSKLGKPNDNQLRQQRAAKLREEKSLQTDTWNETTSPLSQPTIQKPIAPSPQKRLEPAAEKVEATVQQKRSRSRIKDNPRTTVTNKSATLRKERQIKNKRNDRRQASRRLTGTSTKGQLPPAKPTLDEATGKKPPKPSIPISQSQPKQLYLPSGNDLPSVSVEKVIGGRLSKPVSQRNLSGIRARLGNSRMMAGLGRVEKKADIKLPPSKTKFLNDVKAAANQRRLQAELEDITNQIDDVWDSPLPPPVPPLPNPKLLEATEFPMNYAEWDQVVSTIRVPKTGRVRTKLYDGRTRAGRIFYRGRFGVRRPITITNDVEVARNQLIVGDILERVKADAEMRQMRSAAFKSELSQSQMQYFDKSVRQKVKEQRQLRIDKRTQIENQPKYRDDINQRVSDYVSQSQNIAQKIDEIAQHGKVKFVELNIAEQKLTEQIKQLNVPTVNDVLDTVTTDNFVTTIEKELDDFLNDPFKTDPFFTPDLTKRVKQELKTVKEKLKVAKTNLGEPQRQLAQIDGLRKRINSLRQSYDKNYNAALKTDVVKDDIFAQTVQLETFLRELGGLEIDDVGETFYRNDLPRLRKIVEDLRNLESTHYQSPFLKRLDESERLLGEFENTVKQNVEKGYYKSLDEYVKRLTEQQTMLNNFPTTLKKLNREQLTLLEKTQTERNAIQNALSNFSTETDIIIADVKSFTNTLKTLNDDLDTKAYTLRSLQFAQEGELKSYRSRMYDLFDASQKELETFDKLVDPKTYFTLNKVSQSKMTDVLQRKRMFLETGTIREVPVIEKLMGNRKMRGVLDELYVTAKRYDNLERIRKLRESLPNIKDKRIVEKVVEKIKKLEKKTKIPKSVEELTKLSDELQLSKLQLEEQFTTFQKQYLEKEKQLLEQYKKAIELYPEKKDLLQEKFIKTHQQLDDILLEQETQLAAIRLKIDNEIYNVNEMLKVKPDVKLIEQFNETTNKVKYHLLVQNNVDDVAIKYETVNIKDYILDTKNKITEYSPRRRDNLINVYKHMLENDINVEGVDSIFAHIRNNTIRNYPQEYNYLQQLRRNKVSRDKTLYDLVVEFSQTGQDEALQKYFYQNSLRKMLLNLSSNKPNRLDVTVGNKVAEIDDKLRNENLIQTIVRVTGDTIEGKNSIVESRLGLVGKRSKEIRTLLDELNRSHETLGINTRLKLTGTVSSVGESEIVVKGGSVPTRSSLGGRLALEGLPDIGRVAETNADKTYQRKLNKLKKMLGVNDYGMPLYNGQIAKELAGEGIETYEDFRRLVEKVNSGEYDGASLNDLLTASQFNYDELRRNSSNLYLFNFSADLKDVVSF